MTEHAYEPYADDLAYYESIADNGASNGAAPLTAIPVRAALEFQTLADLCTEVDAQGPRRYLIRGIWPAGAYGVHGAEMKAQKTWNALDLAVSVASGTPWLGTIEIDDPGPVIVFAGEGGKASIVRRLRAICAARNLDPATLPIVVCARAPHLSNDHHLTLVDEQLAHVQPRLVVLDPLYLSAGGAKSSDLYAMGQLLEPVQHACERVDAALIVVTHYNRKEGTGPLRITGAGPAEWGRVLIGGRIVSRHTVPDTLETTVTLELDIIGGEIPDQTIRLKRHIHADNPGDLDSPLHYQVEILATDDAAGADSDLAPAARKLLEALKNHDRPATNAELVDWINTKYGHGLKRETVSRHLNALEKAGTVTSYREPNAALTDPTYWTLASTPTILPQPTLADDDIPW